MGRETEEKGQRFLFSPHSVDGHWFQLFTNEPKEEKEGFGNCLFALIGSTGNRKGAVAFCQYLCSRGIFHEGIANCLSNFTDVEFEMHLVDNSIRCCLFIKIFT